MAARSKKQPQLSWITFMISCTGILLAWSSFQNIAAMPTSTCYALDRNNYLYDFTDKIGKELELEGQDSDLVFRFCQDIQHRSQNGYVSYGRFSPESIFTHGFGEIDFFQAYKYGDLAQCEHNGLGFVGREAQVNIMCGSCFLGSSCKDDFGCICNATYDDSLCRLEVSVALNCSDRGPRIAPDISIGFNPSGSEVVKNGITQVGFNTPLCNYSFANSQKSLFLYEMSNAAAANVQPLVHVEPPNGLVVKVSRTTATVEPLRTKMVNMLELNWECAISKEITYAVRVSMPIDGYDPITFFLCKVCETQQDDTNHEAGNFGKLILIILAIATTFCSAWYCYNTKIKHQHGLDAFPVLSSLNHYLLRRVRNDEGTYQPLEEVSA